MEADVLPGMVLLPPTSDFPPNPEPLEREVLNSFDAVRGGSAWEQALALILLEERLQP
jgi:hypothetical protein